LGEASRPTARLERQTLTSRPVISQSVRISRDTNWTVQEDA
jgi:hypothetical protein